LGGEEEDGDGEELAGAREERVRLHRQLRRPEPRRRPLLRSSTAPTPSLVPHGDEEAAAATGRSSAARSRARDGKQELRRPEPRRRREPRCRPRRRRPLLRGAEREKRGKREREERGERQQGFAGLIPASSGVLPWQQRERRRGEVQRWA
jgi:hypothetical protein